MSRSVVHFTDASIFGGAEQMILTLLEGLDRDRWRPVFLHRRSEGLAEFVERIRADGIEHVEVPEKQTVRWICEYVRRERPAIFHAHLNWPLACSAAVIGAARARAAPVVATQQLFVPLHSPREIARHKLVSMAVDRYIAVSRHMARMLQRVCVSGKKKVRVVHNGVPLAPFEQGIQTDWKQRLPGRDGRPVVLAVARLVGQKGIGYLIEAACRVPEAFFVVAGDGPDRAALEARAGARGVAERFVFLGHRQDVPQLLASCDVFVLPSLYEGLPVSVLEAMASAKPVLATDIGGTDEAVQDGVTGLLVPPADPVGLAEGIRRLLTNPELAQRLATRGREWVRREFSSEAVAARTTAIYEELVQAKGGRRNSAAAAQSDRIPDSGAGPADSLAYLDESSSRRRKIRTVVHFTDTAGFGGAEQMLLTILAGLNRKRWRPILVHHGEPEAAQLEERARELGIRTRVVPRMEGKRALGRLPAFVRMLRSERASVFHAHLTWPLACTAGLIGAALARIPAVIATQHCFVPIRSRRWILAQKLVSLVVDRYVAVSDEMAKGLRRVCLFPRIRVQVIHNGIRLDPFAATAAATLRPGFADPADRPIVLSLSRLDRPKGLNDLLSAAQLVPEALFLLAGEGRQRATLEEQARSLGLADRVLFLGHRDDIPELLASCDVFVLPSLYEGLPVSVLEAMAAGKPVVATAVGGTHEVVIDGQTGLLVPPQEPPALAQAIRRILADPTLARKITQGGASRVRKEFRAEKMIERIAKLYEQLLASPRDEAKGTAVQHGEDADSSPRDPIAAGGPKGADVHPC